ncbi:MAG TPA: PAS domain S-box protein [Planktothrix sp.]|jgi:PAS domain S-box-containing protein
MPAKQPTLKELKAQLLAAQAEAQQLCVRLAEKEALLTDQSRENRRVHQELSRITGVLDSKLQEVEDLRHATTDAQSQLKMRESERDLLAVMLNEADNTQRRTIEQGGPRTFGATASGEFQELLKVRSSKEIGNQFLESLPVGILVLSHSGTINSVNQRLLKMSNYEAFDLIHQKLDNLFDLHDACHSLIEQVFLVETCLSSTKSQLIRRDGSKIPVAVAISRKRVNQTILCVIDLSHQSSKT